MWTLFDLCTAKLYTLVSFLTGIVSTATAYLTENQKQKENHKFSIFRFLSISIDNNDTYETDSLFPPVTSANVASSQTLTPQGPLVRQCAVSEFNFDYSAATLINWSDNNSKSSHNTDKSNTSNDTTTNRYCNNTEHDDNQFDPDVLLSQFNASFNYQLTHPNTVDGQDDGHPVSANHTLSPLKIDQFKVPTVSPALITDRLLLVNEFDVDDDDDVPPLDDELFISFFADDPVKRDRGHVSKKAKHMTNNVDTESDGEIDSDNIDVKKEKTNVTPCKIRKTAPVNIADAPYACEFCDVRFKVKGYLTRHVKKHYISKPFKCPYFDSTKNLSIDNCDDVDSTCSLTDKSISRCHITGGFSRRDTLNTHLKALHFIYPSGTKSIDRDRRSGHCGACFKEFSNNKEWLTQHIMTNNCSNLIKKYK